MLRNRFVFFLLIFLPAYAFSTQFRQIGMEDGLSSRQVFRVEKDSSGFVWFFTYLGVDRFDGSEIRHYKLDKAVDTKDFILSSSIMTCDRKGVVWIALKNGKLYSYDKNIDEFLLRANLGSLFPDVISLNDVFFDPDNRLWICLSMGICLFDPETGELTQAGMKNEFVTRMTPLDDETYIVATHSGLYKLLKNTESDMLGVVQVLNFPFTNRIESLFITDNKLFIGTFSDGAYMWDLGDSSFVSFRPLIPSVPIRCFTSIDENSLLVGTDGSGVYQLDYKNKRLLNRYYADEDNGSLSGNAVSDILVDERGCLWISTYANGVSYLDPKNPKIYWLKHRSDNNSIISNHVNVIFEDSDEDFWYGTNDGVSLYQPALNKWTHFLSRAKGQLDHSLVVLALCEDSQKNIWLGGYGIGAYRIDKRTAKVFRIPTRSENGKTGVATDYIYSIYCSGDKLYFGGIEGDFTCYHTIHGTYTYYPIHCVGDIQLTPDNKLYLAGCEGFGIFDQQTGESLWKTQFGENVLQYPVRCLYQSDLGDIWLGTDGNGLVCFNPSTHQAKVFSMEDGLDSNSINNVLEDDSGGIWFTTEKDLYCYDSRIKRIIRMNEFLGIHWGYFNPNAFVKLKNGNLALGTADGVVVFSPDFDLDPQNLIKLIFVDFKLLYQSVRAGTCGSVLQQAINETSSVKLKHMQHSFSISFSAIDFAYPHRTYYEYKLDNFNENWSTVDATHKVDFMNLPPGKYIFQLKAFDRFSKIELGSRSLEIIIEKPFWESYCAYSLYILLLCLIIYLSVQFARHKIGEYKSREKIRSFVSIAHDIRTPIALITAPLSELQEEESLSEDIRKSVSVASKNAEKLFGMVTQLLDLQRADLHPERIYETSQDIYHYMAEKLADFRTLAIQKGITLSLDIEPGFPYLCFDKDKMDKVLDNLLSNALKYTEKGSVSLIVKKYKNKWSVEIRDTGIGISAKDQKNLFSYFFRADNAVKSKEVGSGIGLLFVQKIVKQLRGKISFSSTENVGTSFILTIPLKIDVLKKENDSSFPVESQPKLFTLPTSKNLLLLAEDDEELREYLTQNLSKEYEVVGVVDGKKALELAREINPDIIISDVIMPIIEGTELCRMLKSSVETSHIPVILLTALDEREAVIAGLEAGANDYIIKPFDFSVLKVRIRNILQNRQNLRETVLSSGNTLENIDYSSLLDKEFLNKALQIIENELSNADFSINDFCREIGMSRTSVYNKLKSLTDQSPNDFIRIIRLNRSKELLLSRRYTIGEVSCMVGFSDPKYFSTCFKKQFGISPSKL